MMRWLRGSQQNGIGRELSATVLYVAWGVFVNLCVLWILTPLVQDLALLGVICLAGIVVLWLFSIPVRVRRQWCVFTISSVLFGQGLLQWSMHPALHPVVAIVLMSVGIIGLSCWLARIPVLRMALPILVIAALNAWVPIRAWAFLTHFSVSLDRILPLTGLAYPGSPLYPVQTAAGKAVVTLENAQTTEPHKPGRPDYRYLAIERTPDSDWTVQPVTSAQLAALNASDVISTASPFYPMSWTVQHGTVLASVHAGVLSEDFAQMTTAFVNVPADTAAMLQRAQDDELQGWTSVLQKLGVHPVQTLHVDHGALTGQWEGQRVHVKVSGNDIVGTGSFTQPGTHQVLVEGLISLQIVSLDGAPHVVSTYPVNVRDPMAGNLLIGPFASSGKDAIYVNGSPARILTVDQAGGWHSAYVANNPYFRFLAAVQFPGENSPEILVNDPSDARAQHGTNYFTSYTFRSGHLIRNWRVFRTDIGSLVPIQPTKGAPVELVGGLLGSSQIIVLQRHHLPLLPLTAATLGLAIGGGYVIRGRDWRRRQHG